MYHFVWIPKYRHKIFYEPYRSNHKKLKAVDPKPVHNPTYKTRLELAEDLLRESGEFLSKLLRDFKITDHPKKRNNMVGLIVVYD